MRNFLLLLCVLFAGCNNSTTSSDVDDTGVAPSAPTDTKAIKIPANDTSCYAYQSANDTIMLTLYTAGPTVSGSLVYALREKDKNSGTITGMIKGDTLLADYNFESEGTGSVRQVAFLRKGENFVEGYGDAKMEGGKMVFNNTGALKFNSTMALQKRPCGNF